MEGQGQSRQAAVLASLSSLLSTPSPGEEELRQYWMPDEISVECYDCTSRFTSFRRRHHCRICGQVFCSKCCSSSIPGKHLGRSGSLRVCTYCYSFFQSYQAPGGGGCETAGQGPEGPPGARSGHLAPPGARGGRRQSVDDVAAILGSPGPYRAARKTSAVLSPLLLEQGQEEGQGPELALPQETVVLKDPMSLARLWGRALEGLPLKVHRYYFRSYPDTFEGLSLVSWLISGDSQATSRPVAVAIGQALLTAGYIRPVSGSLQFSDSSDLYSPSQPHITEEPAGLPPPADSSPDCSSSVQEPAWLQELADSPFRFEKRSSGNKSAAEEKKREEAVKDEAVPDGKVQEPGELQEAGRLDQAVLDTTGLGEDTEEAAALEAAYREHEARYLSALLQAAGKLGEEWRPLLLRLAEETVNTVVPQPRDDEMDLRAYVKVKCVAGGSLADCRLVSGEVCSLQLVHKGMKGTIHQPRIALVANSIMFQRDEGRFVSLDTLAMQEEEYIKNVTGRLLASQPSVVLVERTVSRLAQEIFLREGVSLALNVKFRVLTRLARLTQGEIINSVDSMLASPRLGTCDTFYCRKEAGGAPRLLVFEGCKPSLGGTVLLQGGDLATLVRVKAVLQRLLLLKQTWRGEKSLLANEYGALPGGAGEGGQEGRVQLALSPFIRVPPVELNLPHVVEAEDVAEDLNYTEDMEATEQAEEAELVLHPWAAGFLNYHVTGLEEARLQDRLALFRASGRRLVARGPRSGATPKLARRLLAPNLPEDHCEALNVQFSMYSSQSCLAPNYCVAPWVVRMALYGSLDMSLGEFLETLCFSPDYTCPGRGCSTPPLLHTRRFCHAGGAVSLHMLRMEAPIVAEGSDRLMMWKYCSTCELITNIVPVTPTTWALSFAQFLHLMLHEDRLVRRGSSRPDAVCLHSLHQGHLTCFGKKDLVVTFKYSSLHVWRLSSPPPHMSLPHPSHPRSDLLELLAGLKVAASSLHNLVLERLNVAKTEAIGGVFAEAPAVLVAEQKEEMAAQRGKVEELEEKLQGGEWHGGEVVLAIRQLQGELVASRQAWTRKLAAVESRGGGSKARTSASSRIVCEDTSNTSSSTGPEGEKKSSRLEDTTTVKKLISTILPHSEELPELPPVLPADLHLITQAGGEPVSPDLPPGFVSESKPSSLISFLLSSPSYTAYLADRTSSRDPHFVLEFASDTAKFYCCSFFTQEFHRLRNVIFPGADKNFVASLESCRRWEAMGGKSGLLFYKTTDDRFVLKQMSRTETESFPEFAPHYFQHLGACVERGEKTLLAKIVGVFKIGFKNLPSGLGMNMEFLVMENLFYGKKVEKSYDLKGSLRNRLMAEAAGAPDGQVLLDENLIRVSCESPLYIGQADKELLNEAVLRDTVFLASHEMMDYSLLAGICTRENELVVGIIDYIRKFTWDKKVESLLKSRVQFGGPAKTPTVIKPDIYKERFTDAMNRYFSTVPD